MGGKTGERPEQRDETRPQQAEPTAHLDQIGIIRDEGARRAEMDHAASRRRRVAEQMDMRHHVMAKTPFILRRLGEINVVEMFPHVRYRGGGDIDAQFPFGLRKRQPEAAPESMPRLRRPERDHRRRGVALGERGLVSVVAHRI